MLPLDLCLIYGKETTKTKMTSFLAPNTIIVKGLLAFPLKCFLAEDCNLSVLLGFGLKHCYSCPNVESFIRFCITEFALVYRISMGSAVTGGLSLMLSQNVGSQACCVCDVYSPALFLTSITACFCVQCECVLEFCWGLPVPLLNETVLCT